MGWIGYDSEHVLTNLTLHILLVRFKRDVHSPADVQPGGAGLARGHPARLPRPGQGAPQGQARQLVL